MLPPRPTRADLVDSIATLAEIGPEIDQHLETAADHAIQILRFGTLAILEDKAPPTFGTPPQAARVLTLDQAFAVLSATEEHFAGLAAAPDAPDSWLGGIPWDLIIEAVLLIIAEVRKRRSGPPVI
jgi:hypothetical protein